MRRRLLSLGMIPSLIFLTAATNATESVLPLQGQETANSTVLNQQDQEFRNNVLQQMSGSLQKRVQQGTAGAASDSAHHADEWGTVSSVLSGEQMQQVPASSLEMIQAPKAWQELGVKGEGMLISIVDTGINPKHPDLPQPKNGRAAQQKTGTTQKVIAGYNWADRNLITKDVGQSQHGMHVAGIAAANGKMKGVAPEAQLLSEKVFSNYHGEISGLSESILFAVTDSIAKKADVINLSLGSSAGYVDDTNTEQYAIKKAVDNGVIVVAAAGNDAYFGSDKVRSENPDVSMIGSPGLAPDALSVASANATTLAGVSFSVDGATGVDRVVYFVGRPNSGEPHDPEQALAKLYKLVYLGKGKKEDYNINVKGDVVLVERGDISFDEKLRLAKQAGAAGVILYNSESGPLIMSANETKNIPAVSILKEVGEKLASQLKKGKKIQVQFDGQYAQNPLPYPNGGTVSGFSSWGPTPDLQFKPEITAPGGGILSTVLEHDYAVKSGTSMATPHVAGGMALLKQSYIKKGAKLEGRNLVETLKAAVMNTAEPIMDPRDIATISTLGKKESYPYSPRVQGAGMMQIVKASKTPVVIVDRKGKAGVSLGEIGGTTTFSLFLENKFGSKPVTYSIKDPYGVLTDLHHDGKNMLTDVPLAGAKLSFSATKVTVNPKQRLELKVTLSIPKTAQRNIFAEGFLQFVPESTEVPVLHVPYYGFYGDWDEPRIMDQPMWDKKSQEKRTGIKTTWHHDKENDKWKFRDYLGVNGVDENGNVLVDPASIAFSPNGDNHYDTAAPSVTFLRNAKQVTIDITDNTGKLIRSLVKDEKVAKFDQSKKGMPYYYTEKKEWSWDGKAYSADKGEYVPVPDGSYQFVIRAKIDRRNSDWQTLTLPIRVDTKAPSVTASLEGKRVSWKSRDKDIQGYLLYVDGKKVGGPYSSTTESTYVTKPHKKITLVAYDYAGNIAIVQVNGRSDTTPPVVEFPNDIFEQVKVTKLPHVPIQGKISGEDMLDRVKLTIGNQHVKLDSDGSFQTLLTLPEGLSFVTYQAVDAFGNQRQFTQRVIVDSTPPQMMLMNDGGEELLYDANTKKMLLPIRLGYRDANYKGQIKINGQIISSWEEDQLEKAVQKNVTHTIAVKHGENKVLVEGADDAQNITPLLLHAYVDTHAGTAVLQYKEQRLTYQAKPVPPPSVGFAKASYAGRAGDSLSIYGRVVAQTQTTLHFYYGDQRLQADVNDRGEFRLPLHSLKEGKEHVTVIATDPLGREAKAQADITGKK